MPRSKITLSSLNNGSMELPLDLLVSFLKLFYISLGFLELSKFSTRLFAHSSFACSFAAENLSSACWRAALFWGVFRFLKASGSG